MKDYRIALDIWEKFPKDEAQKLGGWEKKIKKYEALAKEKGLTGEDVFQK